MSVREGISSSDPEEKKLFICQREALYECLLVRNGTSGARMGESQVSLIYSLTLFLD